MVSNQKLFSVGTFDFRLQHVLVIGVLILSFSISMLIRSMPMSYETELFEYDPFFNYRATEYVVQNGIQDYLDWNDNKSWHPTGRNISETSQVTLHLTAAILYQIFNFGTSLYTFTILFPLVIGSLTSIAVFALVRTLGGTTAGLFASLLFAFSIPILIRGFVGWFKSEPLGIFFGIIGLYLFVSGIKNNKGKISGLKLTGAGLFLALSLSAWGGAIFFILAIILFLFALPFFKNDKNFLIWITPLFSISFIIFSLMFERTSNAIIFYIGIAIGLSTTFVVLSEIIKNFSSETKQLRNCLGLLVSIIISGIGIASAGAVALPSFRYQNAINPLLLAEDPLTDSVSEHAVTDLQMSFSFLSVFIIFGIIGAWLIFTKKSPLLKNDMKVFSLMISFFAIYLSSAFLRLEVFASVGLFILGGIGLSLLLHEIFKQQNSILKIISSIVIVGLFLIPVTLPEDDSWFIWADFSPTIINGGTGHNSHVSYDWLDAMEWLKQNTPEHSVIASWWDYGYWITTLSDRTTIIDNATLNDLQIKKMAYSFLASPDDSWKILSSDHDVDVASSFSSEFINFIHYQPENYGASVNGMDADYIVIFVVAEKIAAPGLNLSLYSMQPGGDESKKHWFAAISNQNELDFMLPDGMTPTNQFMNSTLGKLIPFTIVTYVDLTTDMIHDNYRPGYIPIYAKELKFSDTENDPFYLVYASPSFYSDIPGQKNMILIYKINQNYQT